jgi:hypothetical protein
MSTTSAHTPHAAPLSLDGMVFTSAADPQRDITAAPPKAICAHPPRLRARQKLRSSRHPSDTAYFPEPARQSGPVVAAIDAAKELAEGRSEKQQIGISRVSGQEIC